MKGFAAIVCSILASIVAGCARPDEARAKAVADAMKKDSNYTYAIRWVDKNVRGKRLSEIVAQDPFTRIGMGTEPGEGLALTVNWDILGFDSARFNQVRGIAAKDGKVKMIYFGNPRVALFVSVD